MPIQRYIDNLPFEKLFKVYLIFSALYYIAAYENTPQVPLNSKCGVEKSARRNSNRIIGGHPVGALIGGQVREVRKPLK